VLTCYQDEVIAILDTLNQKNKNIVIAILLSMISLIGLAGGEFNNAAAIFYPAAGIYTTFYFLYRKKVLPGIIIALLVANLGFRLIFSNELFHISLILSLLFVISNLIESLTFARLMDLFKMRQIKGLDIAELGKYVLVVMITSLFGAITGVGSLMIFYQVDQFWLTLLYWWLGSGTGILIIGSLIINSHFHDEKLHITKSYLTRIVTYLISYIIMVYILFSGIGPSFLNFSTAQIVLVFFYIIAAFAFSFRMIVISDLILISVINFVYLNTIPEDEQVTQVIWLILFVIFMSSIASIVRLLLIGRQDNYDKMKSAKNNLEKIILSTNELLKYENSLPEEAQKFSMAYLKNMFDIACEIYPKFDKASCSIKNGPYVEFVSARGYDINHLNQMNFLNKNFMWSLHKPEIVKETDYNKAFLEKENASDFVDTYGILRESIRFTVVIGENEHANMSFDIYNDSPIHFNQRDLANYQSFQTMMNSYYRVGILKSQTEQLKDDIVASLVRTLELYDLYTGGHSEEVADLSVRLGRRLDLPKQDLLTLYWAGIVHDIGKIGIPYDILNKKGKLTSEEYNIIKEHPTHGYNILSQSKGLHDIAEIVLHHHEWWNGKGYPEGLKAEKIPFLSQILHVCDAVDAMAKDRIYRPGLSDDQIIDQLEQGRAKQFSPLIADEMIDFIKQGHLKVFFAHKHQENL